MPVTKDEARSAAGLNGHAEPEAATAALPILSFEDIMAAEDAGEKVVAVPGWPGAVVIRGLTRDEFYVIQRNATDRVPNRQKPGEWEDRLNEGKFEALLLEAALVQPKLSTSQVQELRAKKGVGSVGALVKAITDHLGATKEAQAALNADFPDESRAAT